MDKIALYMSKPPPQAPLNSSSLNTLPLIGMMQAIVSHKAFTKHNIVKQQFKSRTFLHTTCVSCHVVTYHAMYSTCINFTCINIKELHIESPWGPHKIQTLAPKFHIQTC